jgi:hypothetical protein
MLPVKASAYKKVVSHDAESTIVTLERPIETAFEYELPRVIEVPSFNQPVCAAIMGRALENNHRIAIRPSRLKELQELESSMPELIEKALVEMNQKKLAALREKDKSNPEAVKARVKKYNERHREEINARRREQWASKKAATPSSGSSTTGSYISPGSRSTASSSTSATSSSTTPINIICEGNVIDFS